jgi:hypothetical protein
VIQGLAVLAVIAGGLVQPFQSDGQEPAVKGEAVQQAAPAQPPESDEPLSTKYRFTEKYGVVEDPTKPELITQYMVASVETIRTDTETAQGAPERAEYTYQTIYTERPAQVSKLGDVTDAVRRYDVFRIVKSTFSPPAYNPPLLKDLTIWWKLIPGRMPQIQSLTGGHPIRAPEYVPIVSQLFVPQLTAILPRISTRVGDAWRIPRSDGQKLLGKLPDLGEYALDATLAEVHKAGSGATLTAVIEISGQVELEQGPGAVRARMEFEFEPPPVGTAEIPSPLDTRATTKPAAAKGADTLAGQKSEVIARGRISKLLMNRSLWIPIPGDDRLKQIVTRELNLERRLLTPSSGAGGRATPLPPATTPPAATRANSWVLYDDPQGRFQFQYPQELQMIHGGQERPDQIELVDQHARGADALVIVVLPRQSDSVQSRQSRNPDAQIRSLRSTWEKQHQNVVEGPAGWLSNEVWAPLKRRVHRFEAALKPTGDAAAPRVYWDYYTVLFTTNDGVAVTGMTSRDDHLVFRNQVEDVIKSFDFLPAKGRSQAPAAGVAPAPRRSR